MKSFLPTLLVALVLPAHAGLDAAQTSAATAGSRTPAPTRDGGNASPERPTLPPRAAATPSAAATLRCWQNGRLIIEEAVQVQTLPTAHQLAGRADGTALQLLETPSALCLLR